MPGTLLETTAPPGRIASLFGMSSEESRISIFEGSFMDTFENILPPILDVVTDQNATAGIRDQIQTNSNCAACLHEVC
jgi:hypothetical protein